MKGPAFHHTQTSPAQHLWPTLAPACQNWLQASQHEEMELLGTGWTQRGTRDSSDQGPSSKHVTLVMTDLLDEI